MGPPGPGSSKYGSRYSMSRTCGPRDIISLFIPRLGDNSDLIEEIYMEQPPRFENDGIRFYQLNKSLYGLE
jgi:hypothetical protein